MIIPEEFIRLCNWFHPDCFLDYETDEQLVQNELFNANFSVTQRNVLRDYIDELTSGRYSDEELERIWRKSGAGISILTDQEGNPAKVFRMIRSAIDSVDRRSAH